MLIKMYENLIEYIKNMLNMNTSEELKDVKCIISEKEFINSIKDENVKKELLSLLNK